MTVPVQGERHVRVIHFQLSIRLEGDERLIAVDQPVREQDADWVARSFQTEWMVEVRVNVDWVRGVHDLVGPEAELVDELVAGDLPHRKQQIGILKQRVEQLRLPRRARPGEQFVRSRVLVVDVADWFAQDDDLDAEPPGVTEQERMERGEAAEEQDVRFETMDLLEHVERDVIKPARIDRTAEHFTAFAERDAPPGGPPVGQLLIKPKLRLEMRLERVTKFDLIRGGDV